MSQPTRARTTGAATRKARKSASGEAGQASVPTPTTVPAGAPPQAASAATGDTATALAADTLARTLRAVAAELERDPALARRVADAVATTTVADVPAGPMPTGRADPSAGGDRDSEARQSGADGSFDEEPKLRRINRNFRPRLVTGASPDLGAGIPDPFALYARLGEDGLRSALEELRLGTLRAIAREHGLDPKGTLSQQNDADKLRAAILKAAKKGRK